VNRRERVLCAMADGRRWERGPLLARMRELGERCRLQSPLGLELFVLEEDGVVLCRRLWDFAQGPSLVPPYEYQIAPSLTMADSSGRFRRASGPAVAAAGEAVARGAMAWWRDCDEPGRVHLELSLVRAASEPLLLAAGFKPLHPGPGATLPVPRPWWKFWAPRYSACREWFYCGPAPA
jgi:hypothetical protein